MRSHGWLLVALLLPGCATTPILEYRNIDGQVRLCQPDMEKLTIGWVISTKVTGAEIRRYLDCQEDAKRAGFVGTPAGQELPETKRLIREADEARAASIRKQ